MKETNKLTKIELFSASVRCPKCGSEMYISVSDNHECASKKLSETYLDEIMYYRDKIKGYRTIIESKDRTIERLADLIKNNSKDEEKTIIHQTNYPLYISVLGALNENASKEERELAKVLLLELYKRSVKGDAGMTNIKALEIINAMIYDFALYVNTDILDYSKEEQLEAMKIAKNVLANECNKMV